MGFFLLVADTLIKKNYIGIIGLYTNIDNIARKVDGFMPDNAFKKLFNVNRDVSQESTIPLYFQIMSILRHHIHSGALKPGDMIPSETQLCKIYGVSRTTVRQALDQLVEENLIVRRRGLGSFVASPKLQRDINHLYSFTEDMKSMNLKPHSKVIKAQIQKAADDVADLLDIPKESEVFNLTRIRYANNEPMLVENTYLPHYLCPDIINEDFSTSSLYGVLRSNYNLNLYRAVETYESIKLSDELSKMLNCIPSSTGFSIQRIGYLESGTPFELTNSVVRGDKCIFRVELKADNQIQFSRQINL